MPAAANHNVNADLEKLRLRDRHEARVSAPQLEKAARSCRTGEDAADVVTVLTSSATQTAQAPPYDPARVRAGTQRMVLGAVLVLNGFGLGWWFRDAAIVDFASLAIQIGALALVLVGSFLMLTGQDLRTAEHLPRLLTGQDVDDAAQLLEQTREHQRATGSTLAEHLSRALLTADAAVLLFLVAPLILPSVAPFWHLCLVAAGALLIGKLANDAAAAMAVAIRRGKLLAYHDAKASEGTAEGDETAAALRTHYDVAVGGRWPTAPTFWEKYASALPGALFLLAVTGLLLGLRLILGSGDMDVLPIMAVALLMAGTTAVAVALKTRGECLVPEIARAKRIVARFRSGQQFKQEMAADAEQLRMGLVSARQVLRRAAAPSRHGVASTPLDFDALGTTELIPTDTPNTPTEPVPPHAVHPGMFRPTASRPGVAPINRVAAD